MAESSERIELPALSIRRIQIRLVGDAPLIMHRFSEKAKKAMLGTQKKEAKQGREKRDPEQEYKDSIYRDKSGNPCFPSIAFKAAAVRAANDGGIAMTLARRSFHVRGDIVRIHGQPQMREDSVKIGRGLTDLRFRAEFPEWYADLDIDYNETVISAAQLINLFQIAGFGVGIGEWRPEKNGQYGTFHIATEGEASES